VSGNYDRIARFYDVDMARNMAYDDVAFYIGICRRRRGRILELGCGNGRILLELLGRGVDAIGADYSAAMLHELRRRAAERGVDARVCQMDMRALSFRPDLFDVILCPYSLVNYLTGDDELMRALREFRGVARTDGLIAIDSFVPRPVVEHAEFRLDYRRPYGEHFLARRRRIAQKGKINRIDRRYQVVTANDDLLEQIDVVEDIRPFQPNELRDRVADAGFTVDEIWWDYAVLEQPPNAQFFTLIGRAS